MKKLFLFFLILFSIKTQIFGWWDNGHMVIANIAEKRLTPAAKEKINYLISLYADDFPKSNTFITAATWADDAANNGFTGWGWHGQNIPYDPEHILSENDIKVIFAEKKQGAVFGIKQAIKTLKNKESAQLEKAIMLRFLLHIVGDAHMPMHCVNLFNEDFPNGDRGATLYKIKIDGLAKNSLHSLWDSILLRDDQRLDRPLNKEGIDYVAKLTNEVEKEFPITSLEEQSLQLDPKIWTKESYQIAIEHAYPDMHPGKTPPEEYIKQNQKIAYKQLALAGYRLGNLLNQIFSDE